MLKDKRASVDDAIFNILQNNVPEVIWSRIFKGFQRGKGLVGSVVNDNIKFDYDAKNQLLATSTYVIIIADSENTDTVDDVADLVFELLDDDDLNGNVIIGEVKSISYGAAPNKSNAGSALLIYEVKYYV